jgi:hypothetical protein
MEQRCGNRLLEQTQILAMSTIQLRTAAFPFDRLTAAFAL